MQWSPCEPYAQVTENRKPLLQHSILEWSWVTGVGLGYSQSKKTLARCRAGSHPGWIHYCAKGMLTGVSSYPKAHWEKYTLLVLCTEVSCTPHEVHTTDRSMKQSMMQHFGKFFQVYKKAIRKIRHPFHLCKCFHFMQVLAKAQAFCMIIHIHLQNLHVLSKTGA